MPKGEVPVQESLQLFETTTTPMGLVCRVPEVVPGVYIVSVAAATVCVAAVQEPQCACSSSSVGRTLQRGLYPPKQNLEYERDGVTGSSDCIPGTPSCTIVLGYKIDSSTGRVNGIRAVIQCSEYWCAPVPPTIQSTSAGGRTALSRSQAQVDAD
jgi:hypothetical protein